MKNNVIEKIRTEIPEIKEEEKHDCFIARTEKASSFKGGVKLG